MTVSGHGDIHADLAGLAGAGPHITAQVQAPSMVLSPSVRARGSWAQGPASLNHGRHKWLIELH